MTYQGTTQGLNFKAKPNQLFLVGGKLRHKTSTSILKIVTKPYSYIVLLHAGTECTVIYLLY